MKIKGDVSQRPLPSTLESNTIASQQQVSTTEITAQQSATLTEAQVNPAWQAFARQTTIATPGEAPTAGQSNLRQQIQLASGGQGPVTPMISPDVLAQRLGVESSRLAVPASSQVAVTGSPSAPSIASSSRSQSAPIASGQTSGGAGATSVRSEAKDAFEKVVEQSFLPFDTRSDNLARDLATNTRLLDGLSTSEKGRLISIMGEGMVGNADMDGMMQLLTSASNTREFQQVVQMAGGEGKLRGLLTGSHNDEFNFLVDKFATGAMTKDHPLREEARGTFERILRQHHNSFDTRADNMTRDFASNPRMMEALTPLEKGRLIQILGSGVTGEGDEEAMIKVLRGSDNAQDFWTTIQSAGGPEFINRHVDWKEQGQFDYLIDKFRRNPGTPTRPSTTAPAAGTPGAPTAGMPGAPTAGMPTAGMMGMDPALASNPALAFNGLAMNAMAMVPNVQNPWSAPPVMGYNGGFGMGMPGYGPGMVSGMGQPYDLGIGRALRNVVGGIFRSLVGAVMNTVRTVVNVGVAAGIGFLMGGPAGAAMGAANSLMSQAGGMLSRMGLGGLAAPMTMLFSTMMGMPAPMMGMGGAGYMMGMF